MAAGYKKTKSSSEIIDKLNVKNAKIIAIIMVIFFSFFHGYRHIEYDMNACTLIMNDGRYKNKKEWQPYGCMMHNYSELDTKRCFKLHHFLGKYNYFRFIGDSRLFHLYGAFLRAINNKITFKHNHTQSYSDKHLGLKVDYFYNAYLVVPFDVNISYWKSKKHFPNVIILGFGINNNQYQKGSFDILQQFKHNLTKLIPTLDKLVEKNIKVIWTLQEPINLNANGYKFPSINNSVVDMYNNAAVEAFAAVEFLHVITWFWHLSLIHTSVTDDGWSWNGLKGKTSEKKKFLCSMLPIPKPDMKDGLTLQWNHIAKKSGAQILLNVHCNDHMNFQDGSCCTSAEQYTHLQIVTFLVFLFCSLFGLTAVIHEKLKKWKKQTILVKTSQTESEFITVSLALSKLALIMGYFYICDRTNFFMKETKHFSQFAFWIPSVYLLCVGLFFTEDSGYSKVLYRDQTDEWKGWMQLVLLVYHWTDAQKVLPLFLLSKVIISAYVFLSGFGHFFYFWQNGDGSIIRFFRVLFRLNFMQFVVCLCMNRPYQSYEFVPLISFWFVLMHVFLVLPPRITALSSENHAIQYLYLVFKFVFFFGIITTLYMSEVFFEKIFVTRPWKALFVTTDDDITLWWRGWKRERYGVLCGMIFSTVLLVAQKFNFLDDSNHNNLFSNGISLFVTLVSLVGIGSYAAFAFLCTDWSECIEIHSYATFLPIISYIILRNISGVLRTRYSTFFAWFGKISLELCIGQFHIWLAADLNGTLVLLPKYSNINLFITSFIFVCAAHEIHEITNILLPYAVPVNLYSLARNFLLFSAILIPIGIHAGMF